MIELKRNKHMHKTAKFICYNKKEKTYTRYRTNPNAEYFDSNFEYNGHRWYKIK